MYKQILVPLDGSPVATAALQRAIGLAGALQASVTVLMVFDPFPYIGAAAEYGTYQAQYVQDMQQFATTTVNAARTLVEAAGLQVQTRVVESQKTWRAILDEADAMKADLIVMGSHGRNGLDKLVMGSVTQRVLQHTRLPVLVVRD
jgi:nucleotide-binding universal stress UspA family protein